jgi:beta-lactamase class D
MVKFNLMKFRYAVLLILFLGVANQGIAQFGANLDFSARCPESSSGFCDWNRSWGNAASIQSATDADYQCLFIDEPGEQAVVFIEQELPLTLKENHVLFEYSLWMRCDEVEGKGAGLNLAAYAADGQLLANQDMGGFYSLDWLTGTQGWKKLKLSMVCTPQMKSLKIGIILYGKGKVWCREAAVLLSPVSKRKANGKTKKYIHEVCNVIQEHSLVRDSVDLTALEPIACRVAGKSKTPRDCDVAVQFLLGSLREYGDHHSFFMKVEEVKNWETEGSAVEEIQFPKFAVMDRCGYVLVPAFHGGNQSTIHEFADSLQSILAYLDAQDIEGWIVDLRLNTGGNMEPMIVGLGPLFSAEKIGSLLDVRGERDAWYYKEGQYYWDSEFRWELPQPVHLHKTRPIAVLTSNQTGSSGEAVALSFVGNADTRSFGQPTWGLTTGNGSFALSDGSQVFLASTHMCDRNGRAYDGPIIPDVLCAEKPETHWDDVLDTAQTWIHSQHLALFKEHKDWQQFYAGYGVEGSFLLLDLQDSSFVAYNAAECQKAHLPASTFKICNTLIGLETGVISGKDFTLPWDGVKRNAVWDQDYALPGAFQNSVVWFYQEVARRIGADPMQNWLNKLHYGNANMQGGLDQFWLRGELRISPEAQVEFLRRLYREELPCSKRTMDIVKSIMIADSTSESVLRGKTGWGGEVDLDIGWYVGYLTRGEKVYIFANFVKASTEALEDPDRAVLFDRSRREIVLGILEELGIWDVK